MPRNHRGLASQYQSAYDKGPVENTFTFFGPGGTALDDQPPHRSVPEPDHASPRASQRFPSWIWGVYLLLFGASVPWYIPAKAPLRIWFGLPHWVVISLLATLGVAVFTAFVVRRFWPDEEHPEA